MSDNDNYNYICPIIRSIMTDPVIAPDGHTYERCAIEAWLRINPISPLTREKMYIHQLVPNVSLKNIIDEYIKINNIKPDIIVNTQELSNNPQIIVNTQDTSNYQEIINIVLNYNIVRIMSGMKGLKYNT